MKKRLLILLSLLCISFGIRAQESLIANLDHALLNRLVELAKENYPRRKISQVNEKVAGTAVNLEKLSYLDMFRANYIYRPGNRPTIDEDNPYVYNGLQFGVSLNLSSFLSKPFRVRQAKQQLKIARLESEDFDKVLENDVKAKYYLYIQWTNELKNRTAAAQDAKAMFDRLQSDFEQGQVDLDTYTTARADVSNTNSALIQTEVNYLMAKDALEELIGMKLEQLN